MLAHPHARSHCGGYSDAPRPPFGIRYVALRRGILRHASLRASTPLDVEGPIGNHQQCDGRRACSSSAARVLLQQSLRDLAVVGFWTDGCGRWLRREVGGDASERQARSLKRDQLRQAFRSHRQGAAKNEFNDMKGNSAWPHNSETVRPAQPSDFARPTRVGLRKADLRRIHSARRGNLARDRWVCGINTRL